jgi:hypothetical protein
MPAKDRYHDAVKRALIKDGWTIADEQFALTIDRRNLWIDLQAGKAEPRLVIMVEVKELDDVNSAIEALAKAIGKFEIYRIALQEAGFNYPLYMAVTTESYNGILSERIGKLVLEATQIPLIVFDGEKEEIVAWIH